MLKEFYKNPTGATEAFKVRLIELCGASTLLLKRHLAPATMIIISKNYYFD